MKKKFQKICKKFSKATMPLYGLAASLCIFVANSSPKQNDTSKNILKNGVI